jgi:hypothetical protein
MRAVGGTVRSAAPFAVAALLGWLVVGCAKREAPSPAASGSGASPAPSAAPPLESAVPYTPPAPVASGLPDAKAVSLAVNPRAEQAYAGPAGTVRGRVIVKGDPAPARPEVLAKIPRTCGAAARDGYGKLFREGPGRALADVLVAVTGFKGYVPERESVQRVVAKDCFYGTRTLALTYGQSIEVASGDQQTYIPELLGEKGQPQLVATPGGGTVAPVYPTHPGRFGLIDNLNLFMTAEVLVLKYSTHAVTGLDGRFEIPGVPVGEVSVNALLPAVGLGGERKVNVEAGKPTDEIVFELTFDKAQLDKALDGGAPAASATSAASAPTGSSRKRPASAPASSR